MSRQRKQPEPPAIRCAIYWALQRPDPQVPTAFEPSYVPLQGVLARIVSAAGAAYLVLAAAAFLTWRRWPTRMRIVFGGLIAANWLGHAVLQFGDPRFRYFLDNALTILVAITVSTLWQATRGDATGRQELRVR